MFLYLRCEVDHDKLANMQITLFSSKSYDESFSRLRTRRIDMNSSFMSLS